MSIRWEHQADHYVYTAEYEFYQFRAPTDPTASERNSSSTAKFLAENPPSALPSLTEGMFGYSVTRPVHNQDYYYGIYDACEKFRCNIEGWHTESGPGVFEAALEFGEIRGMADRAALFKYAEPNTLPQAQLTKSQADRQVYRQQVRHYTLLHGQASPKSARK